MAKKKTCGMLQLCVIRFCLDKIPDLQVTLLFVMGATLQRVVITSARVPPSSTTVCHERTDSKTVNGS